MLGRPDPFGSKRHDEFIGAILANILNPALSRFSQPALSNFLGGGVELGESALFRYPAKFDLFDPRLVPASPFLFFLDMFHRQCRAVAWKPSKYFFSFLILSFFIYLFFFLSFLFCRPPSCTWAWIPVTPVHGPVDVGAVARLNLLTSQPPPPSLQSPNPSMLVSAPKSKSTHHGGP